ncbi:MAG: hypothetical protein WBZ11_08420 [Candidatus Sulfotelmatobacter sp.]
MKATLEAINQMQADGVICHYAIGGAVGATFYLEPAATYDLDIFVILPAADASPLVSLAPIYEHLTAHGGVAQHEHILIGGWPVRFLVPNNDLEREAIAGSLPTTVDGVGTWVIMEEHLVAIALQTGRMKDYLRILQFIEQRAVDMAVLQAIIERHGLASKWKQFESRFLEGTHGYVKDEGDASGAQLYRKDQDFGKIARP